MLISHRLYSEVKQSLNYGRREDDWVPNSVQDQFTVLTYNIRYGRGLDGVQDLDRTQEVLRQSQAQLIGLQEVDNRNQVRSHNIDQSQYLANSLNMAYHYAPALNAQAQFGNAILTNFPVLKQESILLPKKGTFEDRSVAIAEVLVGKQPLTFMVTHLGLTQGERLEHIELIRNYLSKVATPVILVGDWNEQPGSPAYNKITEVLLDAAAECDQEQPTFPYLSLYENEATVRIDFIFVSPEIDVIDVEVIQNWSSDHLPVRATLSFKKKGG